MELLLPPGKLRLPDGLKLFGFLLVDPDDEMQMRRDNQERETRPNHPEPKYRSRTVRRQPGQLVQQHGQRQQQIQ
ncbi:hypothetical protein D3C87_1897460 [compost metagenome]